eukprot:m.92028 g.92028  ORF g.92028 m.92028 type:complete len:258 (+) comp13332_c0_seq2:223-996(+)
MFSFKVMLSLVLLLSVQIVTPADGRRYINHRRDTELDSSGSSGSEIDLDSGSGDSGNSGDTTASTLSTTSEGLTDAVTTTSTLEATTEEQPTSGSGSESGSNDESTTIPSDGDSTVITQSSEPERVTSTTTSSSTTEKEEGESSGSNNDSNDTGRKVAIAMFILLVVAVIFIVLYKNKDNIFNKHQDEEAYESMEEDDLPEFPSNQYADFYDDAPPQESSYIYNKLGVVVSQNLAPVKTIPNNAQPKEEVRLGSSYV